MRSSAYPAHETLEFLKDDLDGQVHVELLTGAQTRSSTEITDSVTDQTEAIVGLSRRSRAPVGGKIFSAGAVIRRIHSADSDGFRTRGKLDPVKVVKDIRLQGNLDSLGYREALKDRQFDAREARSVELIAEKISVS